MGEAMSIRPIETLYNGYRFRSRLEARWAVFFDAAGIPYEYEPEGFMLENGKPYLPDFYLPWFSAYVEIKPKGISESDLDEALEKCANLFSDLNDGIVLLCKGDPVDMDMTVFCGAFDKVIEQIVPWIDSAVFVEGARGHGRLYGVPLDFECTKHHISIAVGPENDEDRDYYPENLLPMSKLTGWRSQLEEYREEGRSARFEHGEKPGIRRRTARAKQDS